MRGAGCEKERLVRGTEKDVANEEGVVQAPFPVHGEASATGIGIVHDVVMDECEIMQELDGRRRMHRPCGGSPHRFAC